MRGRKGREKDVRLELRISKAESARISEAARDAGYKTNSSFVRDLITFNIGSQDIWSWPNWNLTVLEANAIRKAAAANHNAPLDWLKKIALYWAAEPK